MRTDAHQHYWLPGRGDYGWLTPETGLLYADYMPDQLKPQLEAQSIKRTIVVQAAPTVEETEFLLGLCRREATIAELSAGLIWKATRSNGTWTACPQIATSWALGPHCRGGKMIVCNSALGSFSL